MSKEHSFNVDVAKEYGLYAAIILKNLAFWIEKNVANGKHFHEGHHWTYNSYRAWSELFPYLSQKQLRTTLDKLVEKGILLKGNFNKSAYDRTNWYAFANENEWVRTTCHSGQVEGAQRHHLSDNEGRPIPDSKQIINEDSKQDTPLPPNGDDCDFSFDCFWNLYDKKVDREKCKRKWNNLKAEDKKVIMAYVPGYISATPDKQYRKNPSTFLNNRAWENELPSPQEHRQRQNPEHISKLEHNLTVGARVWGISPITGPTKGDETIDVEESDYQVEGYQWVKDFEKKSNYFIARFNEIKGGLFTPTTHVLTDDDRIQLNELIKSGVTYEKMERAMVAICEDKWHKDQNLVLMTPSYVLKPANMDKYSNASVSSYNILRRSRDPEKRKLATEMFFGTN